MNDGYLDDPYLTPDQIREAARQAIREGRERLAATSAITVPKTEAPTNAESVARARARLEARRTP